MNWMILASNVCLVILNCILLWIVKPIGEGYGKEKGKALARKEDIDKILEEVKAVTTTQEQIKSQLSGDLWLKQTLWNEKKLVYAALIRVTHLIGSEYKQLAGILRMKEEHSGSPDYMKAHLVKAQGHFLGRISKHHRQLTRSVSMAAIFGSRQCMLVISKHSLNVLAKDTRDMTIAELDSESSKFLDLYGDLIKCSKTDIGSGTLSS